MSAGEVQLAALGMEDAYLTGSPQVTYFSAVYRRHTPFSVQSFNIPFENQVITWGNQAICRIPYKGDMIQSTTLAVTLPPIFPVSIYFKWKTPVSIQVPQPYLFVNGQPAQLFAAPGIQTYYTVPSPPWIGSLLSPYVTYSSSQGKFVFTSGVNTVSVWSNNVTTIGVFWGLDPNAFSSTGTIGGQPVTTWTFKGGGPVNFDVGQSGWIEYGGLSSNTTDSLVYVAPSPLSTLASLTSPLPSSFTTPYSYINFSSFVGGAQGISTLLSNTAGGNIQFIYPGIYAVIITPSSIGHPTRIGIGHTSLDAHPQVGYAYDYVYTYNVQFSGVSPIAFLPFQVVDVTQYYFVDIEGASGTLAADTEVVVSDINEFWQIGSNAAIVNNALPFSNVSRVGFNQVITPSLTNNTFSFATNGLYNIHGSLSVNASNTISSVGIVDFTVPNTPVVISQWNSPQSSSPSVNFTLPVQVLNSPTTNNYVLIITTQDPNPLGNAIATSTFSIEYFGASTNQASQQNTFRQNGSLYRPSAQNYPLSTANINLASIATVFGSSYHIHTSPGGNLSFSNSSDYRIISYFETSNAYVSNVSVWSGTDATLARSLLPGNSAQALLVASRSLPIGLTGGYTLDLLVPSSNLANNYQIRVGLTGTLAGQILTNVTANSYFTVLGSTGVSGGASTTYTYVDSVGTYLIDSAELKMGGQSIQTITGEMIEIYNDLFVPQENQPGLTLLTGKQDSSTVYNARTYYINLPFFFYGAAELSLPICALDLQDLEIWVTFNNFQSLLTIPGQISTPASVTATVIVDYAYLSDPEVKWFSRHRQDYIIRQFQYETFNLSGTLTFDFNFSGPVRELYFVIQDASDLPYVYETDPSLGVALTFNGEDFFDAGTMDYNFTRFIAPLEKYVRQPTRTLHLIPLCRNPRNTRPTGSVNMDRIYQKNIQFTFPTLASLATKSLRLMAVSYNILRVENGLAGIMYQ
jgi:hypothetical protein